MAETRARDLADLGGDATGLATDAELSSGLASKVDYALPVNAQTGTAYTFVAADAEKLTTASNAAAVTLTIPPASSVAWPDNTVLRVVNYGAGSVTVVGGSGVTVTNTATTLSQFQSAAAIRTGSDTWTLVPFSGGDSAATVSSTTGSPTITTSDGFTYYTFTASSGSLTCGDTGVARVLVVGGGGGCGSDSGGGAGGYIDTVVTLEAGIVYPVTVGTGGGGAGSTSANGGTGTTSKFAWVNALGGGGGGSALAKGTTGGSAGGSSRVGGTTSADTSFGTQGNGCTLSGGSGGGGAGGAGTNSPGPGRTWINGTTYAAGGVSYSAIAPVANTGNGGNGSWPTMYAGASGVVIVAVAA